MLETDEIETVDGEPMLALDRPLEGLPAELPAHLAAELAELIDDARALRRRRAGAEHDPRVRQRLEPVHGLV